MIWIKTLKIKNFKSIEEETIEFNKYLNILLGPNNAGKSNIMEAIDLLIGDIYLPNFEPSTDHFFNGDENREILLEAELSGDANDFQDLPREIRFKYSKANGDIFEAKNNNDEWGQKYNKPFGYYWDFDKKLFFLRVKSLRNIMEIAPIRWKSPLKYFKEIIIKKAPKEKLDEVIKFLDDAKNKICQIDEVKNIIDNLLTISKDQTDIRNIFLSPSSTKYSDILNEMKVMIDDGYISEVNKKGLGTQNLTIISLFRVMAKYIRDEEKKSIIYGIDEPEIGLHPHGQRQLLHSLKKLSEHSQVIISTHSSNLIDVCEADNIVRVNKEDNKTKIYKLSLNSNEKKTLEVHGRNLNEIFFAKKVLIVEGETEEGFFPEVSRKIVENNENYSFDYNSVSVINGEGGKISFFIKILNSLKIPYLVLIDEDKIENDNFIKNLKRERLIDEEIYNEISELISKSKKEEVKSKLKELNIYVYLPFEKAICENTNDEILNKIKNAIDFVRQNWGRNTNENFKTDRRFENLKEEIFNYLKQNKKWRVGKAVAQELDKNDIPEFYLEIIKKISKL